MGGMPRRKTQRSRKLEYLRKAREIRRLRKLGLLPPKDETVHCQGGSANANDIKPATSTSQYFGEEVKFETEEKWVVEGSEGEVKEEDFEDWESVGTTTHSFRNHNALNAQMTVGVKGKSDLFPCLFCCKETDCDFSWLDSDQDKDFMVMFVLKKVMEVPREHLEEYLRLLKCPRRMITICDECEPVAAEAFAAQQEINTLERKLRKCQEAMRTKIKTTCWSWRRKRKTPPEEDNATIQLVSYNTVLRLTKETRQFATTGIWPSSLVKLVVSSTQPVSFQKSEGISPKPKSLEEEALCVVADIKDDEFVNCDNSNNGDDFLQDPLSPTQYLPAETKEDEGKVTDKTLLKCDCEEMSRSKKTYKCVLCPNLKLQGAQSFVEHVLYHYKRPYQCSECEAYLTGSPLELENYLTGIKRSKEGLDENHRCSMSNLVKVTFKAGKIWKCAYCSQKFHLETERDAHEGDEHANEVAIETPLSCPGCSKSLRDKTSWRLHRALEHPHLAKFGCPHCNEVFKLKSNEGHDLLDKKGLREHVVRNHMFLNVCYRSCNYYECDVCGANFRTKPQLADHFEECHGVDKNGDLFSCCLCFKRFKDSSAVQTHKMKVHCPNREPYFCDLCVYQAARITKFLEHKFMVHGIEPESFPNRQIYTCKEVDCLFKCLSKGTFDVHMMKVHNTERRFKCTICGKGFLKSDHLKTHQKIHSNATDKPYQCEICGNKFAVKNYLYIHMRLSHQNRPFQSTHKKKPSKRKINSSKIPSFQKKSLPLPGELVVPEIRELGKAPPDSSTEPVKSSVDSH